MDVRNLGNTAIDEIIESFLLAFDNYFVKMPTDKDYYIKRWKASKVDFNLSYGMFDNNRLIGFIIHAVDTRNGLLTAFNTGTGVIPEHRGKRIIQTIYAYALSNLRKHGVKKTTLEVITENKIAIQLYKNIGFNICKEYHCCQGEIQNNILEHDILLKEVSLNKIEWSTLPNQDVYSWDNQKESIKNGTYNYFEIIVNAEVESYFIINKELNYIAQFDVLLDQKNNWKRLFSGIKQVSEKIKINNIDKTLNEKITILNKVKLINTVDQFEMELEI
ncbi:Ribosomal protein S18 acetylase RimI [Tenacibaculum sp. MAR_2009_124]|uniref:GNAT family N-acetyltransferase n=1 Tax=Tenacibaculum sp. MAR_2009_124 TaxID=1250059 RepID=UPI00089A0101|nr:GNAT family N-acetyltransferase [Tenacibaculum sp. MAR_2009_124]SEC88838.1 Ribosomal protein S18 acetylase RimI [Tenacibaculum sp. MAR_2009_124]